MNTPDRSGASQRTQRGIAGIAEGRLGDEERDPRAGRSTRRRASASRSATAPGARRRPRSRCTELADDPAAEVLVGQALGVRPARIGGRLERRQDVVVEEVGERPVPDVVEQPGHPHGLGRPGPRTGCWPRRRRRKRGAQAGIERAGPQPGLVHDAEAVGEARVLGGREDPPSTLELADPAQPLEPRRVEEVLLGDVLGRQPGGRRLGRRRAAW